MGHFSDIFRVSVNAEDASVRLSVRSSESQVDEHILSIGDFNAATQRGTGWVGSDTIRTRIAGGIATVSIAESAHKKTLYRIPLPFWQMLVEQFITALRESGVQVRPAIVQAQPPPIRVDSAALVRDMEKVIGPVIRSEIATVREEVAALRSYMEKFKGASFAPATMARPAAEEPVFIPSEISAGDLTGSAQTTTTSGDASDVASAAAALRATKRKKEKK